MAHPKLFLVLVLLRRHSRGRLHTVKVVQHNRGRAFALSNGQEPQGEGFEAGTTGKRHFIVVPPIGYITYRLYFPAVGFDQTIHATDNAGRERHHARKTEKKPLQCHIL